MIPWRVRAALAAAVTLGEQLVHAPREAWPLLTARPAADPPPLELSRRGEPGARIAAVLHCHFPDVLPGLLGALEAIPEPFDLLVTTTAPLVLPDVLPSFAASAVVWQVDNQGRDILPLLRLVEAGHLEGYELACKVHTKKSSWRETGDRFSGDGAQWRDALVGGVLGSAAQVRRIIAAFDGDPALMMVTAPGQVLGPQYWGANGPLVRALARRAGITARPADLRFAAGSMYWVRAEVLRRLGALGLRSGHFDRERGQDDGTTAHAVERFLGYLVTSTGRLVTSDEIAPG